MDAHRSRDGRRLQRTRMVESEDDETFQFYQRREDNLSSLDYSEWGMYYPEASGSKQSPIDIVSNNAVFDQSLADRSLKFNYCSSRETEIMNNGYTVVVYPRSKQVDSGLRIESIGRSVLSGGPLCEDTDYELSEIRFHWGKDCDHGSEHLVNHKSFPMEIQFVHWNSQLYNCIEEAIGNRHGIAIVAMFGQVGREHSGLKIVVDALEDVLYKGRQKTLPGPFNPLTFLPDPALWDFWTYEGSLTTPPCLEQVCWIVLRYPLMMSATQMENFRRLCTFVKGSHPHPGDDGYMVDNFRSVQPMSGRIVRASFQS